MDQQTQQTEKKNRERKFLLVLPALVLPFLTILLWSIGLIGNTNTKAASVQIKKGLNTTLPDAKLKEQKNWNKMSYYEEANKDSARYQSEKNNDPYYRSQLMTVSSKDTGKEKKDYHFNYDPSPQSIQNDKDPNEEKVYQKLAQLNQALNQSATPKQKANNNDADLSKNQPTAINKSDVDRLENMMQIMKHKDTDDDPEIQQLNGMMDKIMSIQHPEIIKEKLQQESENHTGQVYPVTTINDPDNISLLQSKLYINLPVDSAGEEKDSSIPTATLRNAFFSLDDNITGNDPQNTIEAVMQETQVITTGSTVKLRLVNEIYINGLLIPKDNFAYGVATLNGERLNIAINSIRFENNILPVSLSIYDLDGLQGIYIPGAISRDVAKQSGDEALQSIGLTSLDPSIGAQAASAGIQAAKTLISKKIKLVKVTVKAGYEVLLKDNNLKK